MRDAMVALGRRGVDSAALVHRHSLSLKSSNETFSAAGHTFPVVRTAMWARLLYTPISPDFPRQLRRLIKTFKPDILHLHLPNPSVFWALVLPSALRIPWVVHWHSDVVTSSHNWRLKLFYRIYQPLERAVLKHATVIIATSLPYRDSSIPLRPWIDKCQVVPLGVDVDRFVHASAGGSGSAGPSCTQSQSLLHDQEFPLKILAVGRLTYYKGFRYLIEATARAPNIYINLVGDGDQAKELKALAASLKVQDRVIFHGILSDGELARQMTKADCICLPSIERTEAFGLVLLEAMYFGKATVVSDVTGSGMGWIIDDGVTGLKVKPADADALATAFEQLAANRADLARMGERGKEKFDDQFEINHAIEGLLELYQKIMPARLSENGNFSN
ncbi:MAG: glycosyltransferase family 4 protein [Gammaproteobacteria bacterium]|nr:MAG: glycosyltransferase family 4 protein [Gammaproteobacteria bacterium]